MNGVTKFLPVEGEIKEGDIVMDRNGVCVIWGPKSKFDLQPYTSEEGVIRNIRKAKLFLCSTDIQVGDKVEKTDSLSKYWDLKSDNDVKIAKEQGFFKVIGELTVFPNIGIWTMV